VHNDGMNIEWVNMCLYVWTASVFAVLNLNIVECGLDQPITSVRDSLIVNEVEYVALFRPLVV